MSLARCEDGRPLAASGLADPRTTAPGQGPGTSDSCGCGTSCNGQGRVDMSVLCGAPCLLVTIERGGWRASTPGVRLLERGCRPSDTRSVSNQLRSRHAAVRSGQAGYRHRATPPCSEHVPRRDRGEAVASVLAACPSNGYVAALTFLYANTLQRAEVVMRPWFLSRIPEDGAAGAEPAGGRGRAPVESITYRAVLMTT